MNSEKVQEHYAIIPTRTLPDLNKLSDDEKKIYLIVLNRTIGIFEKPYVYEETTIITAINDVEFKTTGKRESQEGWKRLFSSNIDNKTDEVLPQVNQGDPVKGVYNYEEGEMKPPKYYTEGSLLTAMKNVGRTLENGADKATLKETEGLGTEATRADMIERLKASNYITGGKKLMVTEKGNVLCQMIEEDTISNAEMTAKWEQYLKQIQNKKGTQEKFLDSITNFIKHSVETLPEKLNKNTTVNDFAEKINQEKKIGDCPLCQKMVIDKGKFYGCEGYKDGCKFTLPKKWSNKVIPQKNIKELLEKGITSPISGFKSKKGKAFKARLELNNEDRLSFKFD